MSNIIRASLLILTIFTVCALTIGKKQLFSVPPTSVKDTLSTSQLSYFAILQAGNTAGNSTIKIQTTGNGPSKTSNNLFVGDTLAIGIGSSMRTFIIKDIGNTVTISLGTTTVAQDVAASAVAIATRSATHVISFTPKAFEAGGKWQVLIKATSTTGETWNDGIPDQNGFDLSVGFTAADVNCAALGTGSTPTPSTIGTTAVVTTGYSATAQSYMIFECSTPAGTAQIDVGTSITIGGTNKLINPSAASGHTEGTADVNNFILRRLDAFGNVVDADTAYGRIATIESVRVTAQVDPTLSFSISGVGAGTYCGVTMNAAQQTSVTASAVPFGSLAIGSTANTLAQQLSAVTNGTSYVVTAYSPKVMTSVDGLGITIPNTDCDGDTCTTSSAVGWTAPDAAKSEFGYSLGYVSGASTAILAFQPGTNFTAKPFGTSPVTIFSLASTPTATNIIDVCYRATATTVQKAGDYEAQIVYTATATF